jgi:hypothetical protein
MSDFLLHSARKLYEALDEKEIIGRVSAHQLSQEEIEIILANHLRAFLLEHWPDVQKMERAS